ncbi:purine and uridine phosphorylase [Neocallimastix californiae]|jgi:uridine phosphorylase|uniref:Purine and uridine phosphorylase n=1 Tax=Neocallimastix californiae TaxID=1754190 RepID=A0A1Y2FPE9_9FUNG|nr:purine and uridine phosphorylase [Neocallimastix californiae]|eukprot:ORY85853.1 purine and uridine phosphorylase [Neocallimastix californiae]
MADFKKVYSHEFTSANFPLEDDGRTYHVSTKPGEVANRVITVGDHYRAFQIAEYFDNVTREDLLVTETGPYKINNAHLFMYMSKRKFLTITGTYKGVPVSVVAICMGMPMMDFFIRETRHVVKGPMAIIRFGSCGTIKDIETGSIAVATGAFMISRNYDYFTSEKETSPYIITDKCSADKELQEILYKNLVEECKNDNIKVVKGLNGSADSFYSSQARYDSNFVDYNEHLIEDIKKKHPDCVTLEMETFGLFHLAKCISSTYKKEHESQSEDIKTENNEIKTAATTMIFANRVNNTFISTEKVPILQEKMIKSILDSLIEIDLGDEEKLQPVQGSVWEAMVKDFKN